MAAFIPKKLPLEETFGEKLRQARQKKNFRIEEASRRVKIKPDYLAALEAEDWDRLPAGMYGKNFLKEYAVFLGLDGDEAAAYWNNRRDDSRPENPFAQKIVSRKRFLIFPKICRNILAAAALLACFLYLIFYFKNIVSAPDLIVSSPDKNLLLETTSLIVSGQTEAEAEVKINGETVLNNRDGSFSQTVNLKKGLNDITISAKKKYSREQTIIRQILVK